MKGNQPRDHHFVQAEHIRQFTNERKTVFVYSKDGRQFESSAKGIYKKRDLNSYETPGGLDTSFENLVTAVENECWPAFRRTIENKKIDESDIPYLARYAALSRMRNPTIQTGITEFHRQAVESTTVIMDQMGKFDDLGANPIHPSKSITELLHDKTIVININNSVYLDAVCNITERFEFILTMAFRWSLIESPRGRVVVSDHPLTYIHPGENPGAYGITPGGKTCEMAFPLCKYLYLVGVWERQLDHLVSEDAVDELNRRQAMFASRHIASSENRRSYRSLVGKYKHFGFQTLAETLPSGDGTYQIVRSGVYRLPTAPRRKLIHPLEKTIPIGEFFV